MAVPMQNGCLKNFRARNEKSKVSDQLQMGEFDQFWLYLRWNTPASAREHLHLSFIVDLAATFETAKYQKPLQNGWGCEAGLFSTQR